MSQNPPPNNVPNQSDTLTQILEKRTKIIEKMENLRSTLNTFLSKQFSKTEQIVDTFEQNEKQILDNSLLIENQISTLKSNIDSYSKEKEFLETSIRIAKTQNQKMTDLVNNKLPNELEAYKSLYNIEVEIHNKLIRNQQEQNQTLTHNQTLINEANNMLSLYKTVSGINLSKTKEGYLKIDLLQNAKLTIDKCYIVIELSGKNIHVVETYPKINTNAYEMEFQKNQNFTLFLSNIILNEYQQFVIKN